MEEINIVDFLKKKIYFERKREIEFDSDYKQTEEEELKENEIRLDWNSNGRGHSLARSVSTDIVYFGFKTI